MDPKTAQQQYLSDYESDQSQTDAIASGRDLVLHGTLPGKSWLAYSACVSG